MDRRHKNRRTDWRAAIRLVPVKCTSHASEPIHQHPWSSIRRSWVDGQKWQPVAVRWRRLGIGGGQPQDTLNAPINDLWVCVMSFGDYCQWKLQGGYDPTVVNTVPPTTVGAQIIANAQPE